MIKNTPPMGWNSWNTFGRDINEQLILDLTPPIKWLKRDFQLSDMNIL